ncbi:Mss4-like protein [Echria macrotheca]|uniref:Mss4-like protein n=1 Tax=Echria macrotheca TaxID=438768 RepID=A0AAJ0BN60_9PEZI|nr:Mss4-like protein [Echria macrotheca]
MANFDLGPLPKKITGGCNCGGIRYTVNFPEGHDFKYASTTCQCTQCRRNVSGLFSMYHRVPWSAITWDSKETWKDYYLSKGNSRPFCRECGSYMGWRAEGGPNMSIAIGTVDPLYLFGEGWEESGGEVPRGGFGRALANSCGYHEWTRNEIPGVTDNLEMVGCNGRGERRPED